MRKLAIVPIILLLAVACATSGYHATLDDYEKNSTEYAAARDWIVWLRDVGCANGAALSPCAKLPAAWPRFEVIRDEVRAADAAFYPALIELRTTGKKPANFDTLAQTLSAAQQKMIALQAEVKQ